MKKYLKSLLLFNLVIVPFANSISCAHSERGGGPIGYFRFSSLINQIIEKKVFSSEKELFERIKEIATSLEQEFQFKIYENPSNNESQLNKNDVGYTLEFEDNFFEINKKEVSISIMQTKKENESYVWDHEHSKLEEKVVKFNMASNGLSIESEGEHIKGSTLYLKNDWKENKIKLKNYKEWENTMFKIFYEGGYIFAGPKEFSSKGEWEFKFKEDGTICFKGFNNSTEGYSKLRISEKIKDYYHWFDLTLEEDSNATYEFGIDYNREESHNIKVIKPLEYQVYKGGKLIIDIETKITKNNFEFWWEEDKIEFDDKNIQVLKLKPNLKLKINYKDCNGIKTLKVIPIERSFRMRFLKIEFIDENFVK